MQQNKRSKRLIIPVFLNHKGCKHRCIFCNQRSAVESSIKSLKEISKIVSDYLNSQIKKFGKINPKYKTVQIAFYGGSFTCLSIEEMKKYLEEAFYHVKNGLVDNLRVSTRPDCINEQILNILKEYNVKTIEIGCESFDNKVLKILKRGHNVDDIIKSVKLIKEYNFELSLQIMVGLPEETLSTHRLNKDYLIKIKPDFLRIFPLIVLRNTEIEKMYNNGEYSPLSLEDAVKILKDYYRLCEENNINIIQMGLHYSEHLLKNYVAGPLHPSLKDLVIQNPG